MKRALLAAGIIAALLVCSAAASAWPLKEDWGYAAYRKGPCPKCVPGIDATLSTTRWVTGATKHWRQPQAPWLRIKINGRDTDLGRLGVVLDGEFMLPVTTASAFGLTATRSDLNHRVLKLTGGPQPVEMFIGLRRLKVGADTHRLAASPKWYNGKVYMPIDSIGRLLGWEHSYDRLTGVLMVNTTASNTVSRPTGDSSAGTEAEPLSGEGAWTFAPNIGPEND